MIAIAMAAQGRWKFAQPSGATSWITPVMRRRPSAANRVAKPQHFARAEVSPKRPPSFFRGGKKR